MWQPEVHGQRHVRDLRDEDGTGTVTEQLLRYDADGVRLALLRLSSTLAGITRTYEVTPAAPPLLVLAGLPPGTRRFVVADKDLRVETTITVGRREQLLVGGASVEAVVVTTESRLSGDLAGTQGAVLHVDTRCGITVREESHSDVVADGVRVRTRYRGELVSLRPDAS